MESGLYYPLFIIIIIMYILEIMYIYTFVTISLDQVFHLSICLSEFSYLFWFWSMMCSNFYGEGKGDGGDGIIVVVVRNLFGFQRDASSYRLEDVYQA